jgi:hypothetical protein
MMLIRNHRQHPGDSFKRQEASWRRAYAEAFSVRDRFPGVEQIVADMTFIDVKETGHYSAQMRSFSASAKAFFAIACPRALCLEGGFNLDTVVTTMIAAQQSTAAGTLECAGWTEPSRSQHAHCLLQLSYRIHVTYDGTPRRRTPVGRVP